MSSKSSSSLNNLSTFLIFLGLWSTGYKHLIKHQLKHSLSSIFWILIKTFFLHGLILLIIWYNIHQLKACTWIIFYHDLHKNVIILVFFAFFIFFLLLLKKLSLVVSLYKEVELVQLLLAPFSWEIFSVCLIALEDLQEVFECSIVTDFMWTMFGFCKVFGSWVIISDSCSDFLVLFSKNHWQYSLALPASGIFFS